MNIDKSPCLSLPLPRRTDNENHATPAETDHLLDADQLTHSLKFHAGIGEAVGVSHEEPSGQNISPVNGLMSADEVVRRRQGQDWLKIGGLPENLEIFTGRNGYGVRLGGEIRPAGSDEYAFIRALLQALTVDSQHQVTLLLMKQALNKLAEFVDEHAAGDDINAWWRSTLWHQQGVSLLAVMDDVLAGKIHWDDDLIQLVRLYLRSNSGGDLFDAPQTCDTGELSSGENPAYEENHWRQDQSREDTGNDPCYRIDGEEPQRETYGTADSLDAGSGNKKPPASPVADIPAGRRGVRYLRSGEHQSEVSPQPGDVELWCEKARFSVRIDGYFIDAGCDGDAYYRALLAGVEKKAPGDISLEMIQEDARDLAWSELDKGDDVVFGELHDSMTLGCWNPADEAKIAAATVRSDIWKEMRGALWIGHDLTAACGGVQGKAQRIAETVATALKQTIGAVADIWNGGVQLRFVGWNLAGRNTLLEYQPLIQEIFDSVMKPAGVPEHVFQEAGKLILTQVSRKPLSQFRRDALDLQDAVERIEPAMRASLALGWWLCPEEVLRPLTTAAADLRQHLISVYPGDEMPGKQHRGRLARYHDNLPLVALWRSLEYIGGLHGDAANSLSADEAMARWERFFCINAANALPASGKTITQAVVEFLVYSGGLNPVSLIEKSDFSQGYLYLQRFRKAFQQAHAAHHSGQAVQALMGEGTAHFNNIAPVSSRFSHFINERRTAWAGLSAQLSPEIIPAQAKPAPFGFGAEPMARASASSTGVGASRPSSAALTMALGYALGGVRGAVAGVVGNLLTATAPAVTAAPIIFRPVAGVPTPGPGVTYPLAALRSASPQTVYPMDFRGKRTDEILSILDVDTGSYLNEDGSAWLNVSKGTANQTVQKNGVNITVIHDVVQLEITPRRSSTRPYDKKVVRKIYVTDDVAATRLARELRIKLNTAGFKYVNQMEWVPDASYRGDLSPRTIMLGPGKSIKLDNYRIGVAQPDYHVRKPFYVMDRYRDRPKSGRRWKLERSSLSFRKPYLKNGVLLAYLENKTDGGLILHVHPRRYPAPAHATIKFHFSRNYFGADSLEILREIVADWQSSAATYRANIEDPQSIPGFESQSGGNPRIFAPRADSRHQSRDMDWNPKTQLVFPAGMRGNFTVKVNSALTRSWNHAAQRAAFPIDIKALLNDDHTFQQLHTPAGLTQQELRYGSENFELTIKIPASTLLLNDLHAKIERQIKEQAQINTETCLNIPERECYLHPATNNTVTLPRHPVSVASARTDGAVQINDFPSYGSTNVRLIKPEWVSDSAIRQAVWFGEALMADSKKLPKKFLSDFIDFEEGTALWLENINGSEILFYWEAMTIYPALSNLKQLIDQQRQAEGYLQSRLNSLDKLSLTVEGVASGKRHIEDIYKEVATTLPGNVIHNLLGKKSIDLLNFGSSSSSGERSAHIAPTVSDLSAAIDQVRCLLTGVQNIGGLGPMDDLVWDMATAATGNPLSSANVKEVIRNAKIMHRAHGYTLFDMFRRNFMRYTLSENPTDDQRKLALALLHESEYLLPMRTSPMPHEASEIPATITTTSTTSPMPHEASKIPATITTTPTTSPMPHEASDIPSTITTTSTTSPMPDEASEIPSTITTTSATSPMPDEASGIPSTITTTSTTLPMPDEASEIPSTITTTSTTSPTPNEESNSHSLILATVTGAGAATAIFAGGTMSLLSGSTLSLTAAAGGVTGGVAGGVAGGVTGVTGVVAGGAGGEELEVTGSTGDIGSETQPASQMRVEVVRVIGNVMISGGTLIGTWTGLVSELIAGGELAMPSLLNAGGGAATGLPYLVRALEAAGVIEELGPDAKVALNFVEVNGVFVLCITAVNGMATKAEAFIEHPSVNNGLRMTVEFVMLLGTALGASGPLKALGAPIRWGDEIALGGSGTATTGAIAGAGMDIATAQNKAESEPSPWHQRLGRLLLRMNQAGIVLDEG